MSDSIEVARITALSDDVIALIHEYYEAVDVVVRDDMKDLEKYVQNRRSGIWVATLDGKPVGCVALRPFPSLSGASECKRLYVRPEARGRGIADKLLEAMERHARLHGFEWIYLDTYDDLKPAIALYAKRGYEPCERYNDNPQATVFMVKKL